MLRLGGRGVRLWVWGYGHVRGGRLGASVSVHGMPQALFKNFSFNILISSGDMILTR